MENDESDTQQNDMISLIKERKSTQSSPLDKFIFDNSSFYLGELLKYSIADKNFSSLANISQKRITISNDCNSKKEIVDECNIQNVREKIYEMINGIDRRPNKISAKLYNIKSINDLENQSGISFQEEALRFLYAIDFKNQEYKTNVVFILTIEYCSFDISYTNGIGAYNLLDENVTVDTIQASVKDDEIPLFVSSVKYGKLLMIYIKTNQNFEDLQNNLESNEPNFLNINNFIKNLSETPNIKAELYMRGCQNSLILQIDKINTEEIMDSLFGNDNSIGTEIFFTLKNISDNSKFGFPKQKFTDIKILYVISDKNSKNIDFTFLENFRKKTLFFNVVYLKESQFISRIMNDDKYLSHFDILLLGGIDGRKNYSDFNDTIVQKINRWRLSNGFVLFLHDFIVGKRVKTFDPIIKDLGFQKECSSFNSKFEKVQISNNHKCLYKKPKSITSIIDIKKTHESAQYKEQYIIVSALNNSKMHYYCENLEKRVGDLSIGHEPTVSLLEQMLFINIIVRIMETKNKNLHGGSRKKIELSINTSSVPESLNDIIDEDADDLSDL